MSLPRSLWMLLALVLALRLAGLGAVYVQHPGRVLSEDSASYLEPARHLLESGRLLTTSQGRLVPDTFRTPLYSLFIAGVHRVSGGSNLWLLVLQNLLGLGAPLAAYLLGRRLWGRRVGLGAALLLGLCPTSYISALLVTTETLFTLLLMLALLAGDSLARGAFTSRRQALALGLLLALATLTRPVSYYLLGPWLVWLVWGGRKLGQSWAGLAFTALCVLLPWLVLVGGWQVRNQALTGSSQFSHIQAINALRYRAAGVEALRLGISLEEARARLVRQALASQPPGLSEAQSYEHQQRVAMGVMADHPWLVARVTLTGLAKAAFYPLNVTIFDFFGGSSGEHGPLGDLGSLSPGEWWQRWVGQHPGVLAATLAGLLYLGLIWAGAARGLGQGLGPASQPWTQGLLLLTAVYLLLVSAGPEAGARFRVPVMPILALYAARGLWPLGREVKHS